MDHPFVPLTYRFKKFKQVSPDIPAKFSSYLSRFRVPYDSSKNITFPISNANYLYHEILKFLTAAELLRVKQFSCNRFLMTKLLPHKYCTNQRPCLTQREFDVAKRIYPLTKPFKQTVYSCHFVTDISGIMALS